MFSMSGKIGAYHWGIGGSCIQVKSQYIYWIKIFKILLLNIQIFRFHTGAPSPNNGFHATVKIGMFLTISNLFLIWIAQNVITSVSSYWSENITLNILIFRCKFANASFASGEGWIFCSEIRGKNPQLCRFSRSLWWNSTAGQTNHGNHPLARFSKQLQANIYKTAIFPNNNRQIFIKLQY